MSMSEFQKNSLMLAMLACSLFSGILFSVQQRQLIDGQKFNHPICQTLQMFMGECVCYLIYIWFKNKYRTEHELERVKSLRSGASEDINVFLFAIPAFCDFVTSTISFFTMSLMPLSIQYMFNGGNIIMTAIFSILFLKRKLYRQNYFGISLNIAGLLFMGVMMVFVDSESSTSSNTNFQITVGILLTFASFFTYATQMVMEERFFKMYVLNPFQAVGYEGFWGVIFTAIGILVFSFLPNPNGFPETSNGMVENFPNYMYQVFSLSNPVVFYLFLVSIAIIIGLNGIGQAITKNISSLARAVLGVTSPFLLWIFCLCVGWETFKYYQLIAYVTITAGTLIYNEIIVIPFFGMDTHLKRHAEAENVTTVTEVQPLFSLSLQKSKGKSSSSYIEPEKYDV